MLEPNRRSVQKISPQGNLPGFRFDLAWRAVQPIPNHRMTKRRKMHADLVGAPGIDLHFQQTELAIRRFDSLLHRVMRNRLSPGRSSRGHADAPHSIAADARVNGAAILLRPTMDQCDVGFLDLAPGEL